MTGRSILSNIFTKGQINQGMKLMRRDAREYYILPLALPPASSGIRFLRRATIFLALAAVATEPGWAASVSRTADYQQVIEQARSGRHAWALHWLDQQGQLYPQDQRIRHDQLIIAGWAGQYQDVIRLHQSLAPEAFPLPRAALAATARAYRDDRQWQASLALYREGMRRYPHDQVFSLGEIEVLADAGEAAAAVAQAQGLVQQAPDNVQSLLTLSYAHRRSNQPYAALAAASRAYTLAPEDRQAVLEYIQVLVAARMASAALRTAQAHPTLISEAEVRQLEGDRAAELTRIASMPARQESERFVVADLALDDYGQLLSAAEPSVANAPDSSQRSRIDRLLALYARSRQPEIIAEYESLTAEGVEIPQYALGVVADAYLDQRQPEKSTELYLQILNAEQAEKGEPSVHLSHQSGLFYSLIETEQFDQAQQVMATAIGEQPAWLLKKGTPLPHPNDLSLEANQQAVLGQHYADNNDYAQERLEELVARAPGNSGLRSSLSQVYLARGWPRRSERELKIAETQTPLAIAVITAQAHTAMALQEWEQAEALIQNAQSRYPENGHVRQLVRDWERHNRAELLITGHRSLASDSPVAGNGDFGIDTVVYTPPLNHNWRGFAGGGYATADFENENADYHWFRAGAEWRSRALTVEAEASSHHYGQGSKVGARVQGTYDLTDQWQISGQYAFRSRETPLRALANDITSNRLDAQLRWNINERREWSITLSPSRFSDGNRRMEAAISGRERLYTAPHLKLDGLIDVYGSHNTREDAPYFNPRADFSVLPALALTHTLYRRYEHVLEHRFMVGAGVYSQRDFGSGAIVALGYGVRYRVNEAFNAGVSVTGISRPYDGQREREARIMFDLQLRF